VHISFIGLFLVAAFYVIAGAALMYIGRRVRPGPARWMVVAPAAVVVLALPWLEEAWIAWQFSHVCRDAGLHVTREVRAEGFYDDTIIVSAKPGPVTRPAWIDALDRAGYSFTENRLYSGKVSHVEKVNGRWTLTVLDKPTARYHFESPVSLAKVGQGIYCSEETVVDTQTKQTIASYMHCSREGSVLQFNPYPIEFCPTREKSLKVMLYSRVVIPVARRD